MKKGLGVGTLATHRDEYGIQTSPAFECDEGAAGICMAEEILWAVAFSVSFGIGADLIPINLDYGSGLKEERPAEGMAVEGADTRERGGGEDEPARGAR